MGSLESHFKGQRRAGFGGLTVRTGNIGEGREACGGGNQGSQSDSRWRAVEQASSTRDSGITS